MIEWGTLRIGVDLCTQTDVETVPHCFTTEVPVYTLEIRNDSEEWEFLRNIPTDCLSEVVEEMHGGFDRPVRLLESGYPVFEAWS